MKNINSILIILLVANAFIACENESMNIEEETEFIVVAGFTYGKYNGVWYHVFDGEKGDQVGFDRLVVKPKTGIDMYIYDFQAAGVPILSVVSKLLADYFVLNTSGLDDPFDVATKLYNTGDFEYIQFDAIGTFHIHAVE